MPTPPAPLNLAGQDILSVRQFNHDNLEPIFALTEPERDRWRRVRRGAARRPRPHLQREGDDRRLTTVAGSRGGPGRRR